MLEPQSSGNELDIFRDKPTAVPTEQVFPKLVIANRRDMELLKFSSVQSSDDYTAEIGYSPALFSQVSLPYKDPKDQEIWIRKNGDVSLQVTPRSVQNEVTGVVERRYPFGITPRLLVAYLTTEATRNQSRNVELGATLTEFMRNLGMKHTGPNAKRLRDHMQRFFGATITFDGKRSNAAGEGSKTVFFQFASEITLWDSAPGHRAGTDIRHRAPWESEVILSESFYNEIMNRPVPLDLNALRALGSSPLRVDVYLWVNHRLSWLKDDSYIKWEDLASQFGAQFAETRQFKAAFLEAVAAVQKVLPGLNFDEAKGCFVLKPGRTAIASRRLGRPRLEAGAAANE